MKDLNGKVAFITGGASGIGLGLGKALAGKGCRVVLADINEDALEAVARDFPADVETIRLDVRDRAQWLAARARTEARFGPVSILVNNAGIMNDGGARVSDRGLVDQSPESFDRVIAINLTGVFNGIWTFAPGMRDRGEGNIVNTASTGGMLSIRGVGAYSASKFGVVALSESLRDELAPRGVGVSVLCPGIVQTGLSVNSSRLDGSTPVEMPPGYGMDPAVVAEAVITGILENSAYIFTHGEYAGAIERRHARILEAVKKAPVSSLYKEGELLPGTPEWAISIAEAGF